jgi:surface protein
MFSGESKNSNVLFTQDGTVAVVSTTSSIGYGVPAGNLGRNFPNTGFDHVTLRFSSASVDCFINGIPISASGIFPTVPSSSTFNDFKIGGNYLTSWTGSFSGSLGQLMVYNRVLSDDEIYSNYLIQARRYGLPEPIKPYTVDSSVYVYTQAANITGSTAIAALDTFVRGLKSASLWEKMIAIYPFIETSPSASRLNLKDVSLNTTQVNYSGSWSTSLSGSYNNNTASYGILSNITPTYVHPLINSQSIHLSYLSYDTPVSGGYLIGVEQLPGLPGDISTPAAAYSVRKVRTAYTGFCMDVRRDLDNTTGSIGFDAFGNLDTGSLLAFVTGSAGTGSGFVAGWYDQSGNNRHAIQSVVTDQPLIVSSGSIYTDGNRPAVFYNGTSAWMIFSTIAARTAIAVQNMPTGAPNTYYYAIGRGNAEGALRPNIPGGSSIPAYGGTLNANDFQRNGLIFVNGTTSDLTANRQHVVYAQSSANFNLSSLSSPFNSRYFKGTQQEIYIYTTTESTRRGAFEQNINTYFNLYPQPYNQNINSLSLFSSPTVVAGGANAVPTQLTTGGPEGLITVSRIGSSDYTLWKNRVPTKTSFTPGTPLSNEIYLNAANVSNSLFSGSQNTVAYASVGAGLTDDEVYTYYELVDNLQTGLGRRVTDPTAFITTWDTRISGTGTISNTSSIVLPFVGTPLVTASWGDGTVSFISQSTQLAVTHSYATPGIYTVTVTGTHNGFRFAETGDRAKILDIGQWGGHQLTTGLGQYNGCFNLNVLAADAPSLAGLNQFGIQSMFSFSGFRGYINNWDTTNLQALNQTFRGASRFNSPLDRWDVSKVDGFGLAFQSTSFNQPINTWRFSTSSTIAMSGMFDDCFSFNQNIGSWNVEKVTTMATMLSDTPFNNGGSDSINNWRPISCSNFSSMFSSATAFNQPIGNWPLSASNINMSGMFNNADAFNQNIGAWNVEKVTNMSSMFTNNGGFNNSGSSDINNWRPISCSNFSSMFQSAIAFNQPVEGWTLPTDRTYTMQQMFTGATSFNQPLGNWTIVSCSSMVGMLDNCGMGIGEYSATLVGWATQPDPLIPRNLTLGATGRQYDTPGSASRAILTSSPYNWIITGDTFVP